MYSLDEETHIYIRKGGLKTGIGGIRISRNDSRVQNDENSLKEGPPLRKKYSSSTNTSRHLMSLYFSSYSLVGKGLILLFLCEHVLHSYISGRLRLHIYCRYGTRKMASYILCHLMTTNNLIGYMVHGLCLSSGPFG